MSYKERAKQWYSRALNENDPFVKFLLYYITLEVSIKGGSLKIRDLKQDAELKKYFISQISESQIATLKKSLEIRPLKNENPSGDKRWSGKLTSSTDFEGIIEYIIRARNNLFHGDKGPEEERDIQVIKWANLFLEPIVMKLIE